MHRVVVFALCSVSCLCLTTGAFAQSANTGGNRYSGTEWEGHFVTKPPAETKQSIGYDFTLKPTLAIDTGLFVHGDAWFGEATANIGQKSDVWHEGDVKAGFEIETGFYGDTHIKAALNAIYAWQVGDTDAAGSTVPDEDQSKLLPEDAYIRIDSGTNFPELGDGAIYASFGRQQFKIGNGLLVKSGSSNGGDRGAFWIGPRKAFELAGIIGLDTQKLDAQAFYLQPDDNPNTDTQVGGFNLDWEPIDQTKLGFAYMNFLDADSQSRNGLNVYNIRASTYPFESIPGLAFGGEYVFERNGDDLDADGGWIGALYKFNKMPWTPSIGYRYAWFEGDDPDTAKNEEFDPLFYGSTDWGTWYQGEIMGEYALSNSNLASHAVRLRATPTDNVTLTTTYYHFRIPEESTFASGVTDDHYGDEVDLLVDWTINDNLSLSGMVGVAVPGDGAEQATGGDENWTQGLVSLSWNF